MDSHNPAGSQLIDRFVLVVGAMKAGTTTLDSYLRQHPQVAFNRRSKEPNFFAFDAEYQRGIAQYFAQWDYRPTRHRFALESSTTYSQYPTFPKVPERIKATNAHFRLIYVLRNPIDRIESQLAHAVAYGWITFDRKTGRILAARRKLNYWRAIFYSSYAMQLDRYRRTLPATPILLVDFDELRTNPQSVLRKITRYLDLDEFQFSPIGTHNPRKDRYGSELVRLSDEQRLGFRDALAEDVSRLIGDYGFNTDAWSEFTSK